MRRRAALVVAVLAACAFALGGCVSTPEAPDPAPTTHGDHGDAGHMTHDLFEVDADGAPQIVSLTVTEDAAAGFNVHIETANFTWAPEAVNTEPVAGEGHAHLYVDGVKVARLYAPDFHVMSADVTAESHFRVTLNANDHSEFAVNGVPIAAEAHVTGHGH